MTARTKITTLLERIRQTLFGGDFNVRACKISFVPDAGKPVRVIVIRR